MDSSQSQGSKLTGLMETASIQMNESRLDGVPIYAKELIAGGFAGALSKTVVAPLERVKILWQIRTTGFQPLGVCQSLNRLFKHEGFLGLYKGNGASVIRIVPYAALHFMAYERYKSWILNNYPMLGSGPVVDLLAGSAGGGTAVLYTYPLDLARTKLAYQVVETRSSIKDGVKGVHSQSTCSIKGVLTSVYKEGGVRGLYRGVGPTITGILPYAGLKFYMYEKLKLHVPEEHQKSILMQLSCGALAGLFGQTLTYPLDVVKRQMQVGSLENATHEDTKYKNTVDGLRKIVRNQGWRQLFAGVSINYIRIVPTAAISFTTYDIMKTWLGIPPQQKSQSISTG